MRQHCNGEDNIKMRASIVTFSLFLPLMLMASYIGLFRQIFKKPSLLEWVYIFWPIFLALLMFTNVFILSKRYPGISKFFIPNISKIYYFVSIIFFIILLLFPSIEYFDMIDHKSRVKSLRLNPLLLATGELASFVTCTALFYRVNGAKIKILNTLKLGLPIFFVYLFYFVSSLSRA